MQTKMFTIRFSNAADGFDDTPIIEFTRDKELISANHQFFVHEMTPYVVVYLNYREAAPDEAKRAGKKVDERASLDEAERRAYDALRTWRTATATKIGKPPYVIFKNKHLTSMIKMRPGSVTALTKVRGIGETKAKLYGEEVLAILKAHIAIEETGRKPEAGQAPDDQASGTAGEEGHDKDGGGSDQETGE